ncbi:MAG: hypothetical protein LC798_21740, partial [Chloroflexi bacterium]|nr:hypothetical protein [Chloroflexota bacterium]
LLLLGAPPVAVVLGLLGLIRGSARRRLLLAAAGVAGAAAVEVRGADRPEAGLAGHATGVAAMAATSTGWLLGVYGGLLARLRSR